MLTHGNEDGVLDAYDATYSRELLWEPFMPDKCHKSLIGKPKLFFIQVNISCYSSMNCSAKSVNRIIYIYYILIYLCNFRLVEAERLTQPALKQMPAEVGGRFLYLQMLISSLQVPQHQVGSVFSTAIPIHLYVMLCLGPN